MRCASTLAVPSGIEVVDLSAVPDRKELKAADTAAKAALPHDPTPTLAEIASRPDVSHQGAPEFAPQPVDEPLRLVVIGSDAALSAVLTRAMRADYLWAHVALIPEGSSTAAKNWGLPSGRAEQWALASEGTVKPAPLIRNDQAVAVAGSAGIRDWDGKRFTGEIVVDNSVLARSEGYGARLVPTLGAPGIAAVRATAPETGWRAKFRPALDPESLLTGRAVQAGGPKLRVTVDGVSHKRPVERVTFYRHLRDLQVVRP
ncbi:hypothetical protein F4V58_10455 [Corynebacterium phocae]|nr:hypothetical protein F4V58_10455 [Corynebacterium phocae]